MTCVRSESFALGKKGLNCTNGLYMYGGHGLADEGLALGSLAWAYLEIELWGLDGEIGGEKPQGLIDSGRICCSNSP